VLEQKHHQQTKKQGEFLLRLIDSLRPLVDPAAIQYTAMSALGQQLGANRVGYAETQPNAELVAVTRHYTWGVTGIEGVHRYRDYGVDLISRLQQGRTVVRSNIAADPTLTDDEKQAHAQLALGSTLNIPLVKEGHLVAILFVHFQQAHAFSAAEVALAEEIAHQTWAALERARAEDALRRSEESYRLLSAELEERVQARTQDLSQVNADLERSNDNLQQFAYVASHDLQEPLRKIQSFSILLREQYTASLDETGLDLLRRMQGAGERMATLMRDLLAYSRIATRQEEFEEISLKAVVVDVLSVLDWEIQQTQAQLVIDALPVVNGDAAQLGQLFQNLLTNALKFVQPGQVPSVHIQYAKRESAELPVEVRPAKQAAYYHQISVKDEGVGFDN
jgi:signal transduction histidine kinase